MTDTTANNAVHTLVATPAFSIRRLMLCISKRLGEEGKWLFTYACLAMMLMLTLSILTAIAYLNEAGWTLEDVAGEPTIQAMMNTNRYVVIWHHTQEAWLLAGMCGMVLLGASRMFFPAASKEGRIRFLLTPASYAEKYFASFIIYILAIWGIAFIAYYWACYSTGILMTVFTDKGAFFQPFDGFHFPLGNTAFIDSGFSTGGFIMLFIIFFQSFFALGSSVWPRNAYIKTLGMAFLLFGLMIALYLFSLLRFSGMLHVEPDTLDVPLISPVHLILILLWVMTIVNYVISYFRFREMDVTPKW